MWELGKHLWLLENCSKDPSSVRAAVMAESLPFFLPGPYLTTSVWRPVGQFALEMHHWRDVEEMESQGALWCMDAAGEPWLVGNSEMIRNGKDLPMGFTGVVKILHGNYRCSALSGVCENAL